MWRSDKVAAGRSVESALPPKIAALLRESSWLAVMALALYLTLILFTFDKTDPGWSHSASVEQIRNSGGRIGAWLSDILLFIFGLSAWWWVVLCAFGQMIRCDLNTLSAAGSTRIECC